jgi:transposase
VRQVIDLPAIAAVVTDHVMVRRRCGCGTESSGEWPAEAKAPVCWGPEVRSFAVYLLVRQHLPVERCAELLADLLDAPVSTGWLIGVQAQAATNLAPFMAELKARLGVCPVVHADETGTRVRTTKHWMHTLTTNLLTLVAVHPKRGAEAIRDIGVLGGFTGTVVHDGWASYDTFTAASHAQCGAHLLRHLQDVGTTPAFATWTAQMIKNLLDAKRASEAAAAAGQPAVDVATANAIRGRYHDTVDVALHLLPAGAPPPRRHRGGWNTAQRKAYNLATRMRRDADQVLRLLDDTRVPFDNNTAERALRMVKLSVYRLSPGRQATMTLQVRAGKRLLTEVRRTEPSPEGRLIHDKISGCFHSLTGAQNFADTRSYLQTADHHHENLLGVLRQLFTTGAWIPPKPAGAT